MLQKKSKNILLLDFSTCKKNFFLFFKKAIFFGIPTCKEKNLFLNLSNRRFLLAVKKHRNFKRERLISVPNRDYG